MLKRRRIVSVALLASMVVTAVGAASAEGEQCTAGPHPGGDWASYGGDLSNTRNQPAESLISTENVATLEAAWTFSTRVGTSSGGQLQGTPVIAGGCVFVGTSTGAVIALHADTGQLMWRRVLEGTPPTDTIYGGLIVGSVAVENGLVYVMVNNDPEPYAVALDQSTGEIAWQTTVDHYDPPGTQINASPVIYDGVFFMGEAGPDADMRARPKLVFLDALTGDILARTPTISDADFAQGYAGGGVWATAVVDEETGYAYVGTSNPYSKVKEHAYSNAIIKIDMKRGRDTFGTVVDSYKGTPDNLVEGGYDQPVCQMFGNDSTFWYSYQFSAACGQLDIDFGASPNLFRDAAGRVVIGELQKSGEYHAVYADTMERAWVTPVSTPNPGGNAASTAFADGKVFAAVNAGALVAVEKDAGLPVWTSVLPDALRYQPVSTANGVLYGTDIAGYINGYDADTGVLVWRRSMSTDTGASASGGFVSNGLAIARNTVFATVASGWLIAYRLPA